MFFVFFLFCSEDEILSVCVFNITLFIFNSNKFNNMCWSFIWLV